MRLFKELKKQGTKKYTTTEEKRAIRKDTKKKRKQGVRSR